MNPNQLLCFGCMRLLNTPGEICSHCGHDNRSRKNGLGMLGECVLANQYQIGRTLGRGGFGVTYVGYDLQLANRVAIKEYYPAHLVLRGKDDMSLSAIEGGEEGYRKGYQRALRESRMAASLRSIYGVVQVYNVFTANNTVYIVMEYVEGPTLSRCVEDSPEPIHPRDASAMLAPVAEALSRLHREKVIHRDVKPDNIIIREKTQQGVLLDFGAARIADDRTLSSSAAIVSSGYAPPEQYNLSSIDGRIDQYSLAATLFFTLSGQRPPDVMQRLAQPDSMPALPAINPAVSPAAEKVLLRGMALRADDRYPDMDAFWEAWCSNLDSNRRRGAGKAVAAAAGVAPVGGLLAFGVPAVLQAIQPEDAAVTTMTDAAVSIEALEPTAVPAPVVTDTPAPTAEPAPLVTETPVPTPEPTPVVTETSIPTPASTPVIIETPVPTPTEKPISADYSYQIGDNGTVTVTGYHGSDAAVFIPAALDGYPVAAIADDAFQGCEHLIRVAIPEGLSVIGPQAFANCTGLTSLYIPESVTRINDTAFTGCLNLTLSVPEGSYAESYAARMGIPCTVLTPASSFEHSTLEDGTVRIDRFIGSQQDVAVPPTINGAAVTAIGEKAFYENAALSSISLPEGIVSIGNYAFAYSKNLTAISLPEGLVSIGKHAFFFCERLDGISLPKSVSDIGASAFRSCESLTAISIPEGITVIGDSTFAHCKSLTSVTIPDSVTILRNYAFMSCKSLTGIFIPGNVTEIRDKTFSDCPELILSVPEGSYAESYAKENRIPYTAVSAALSFEYSRLVDGTIQIDKFISSKTDVVVPSEIGGVAVTSVGDYAFFGCQSLTGISIPEGVTSISDCAFSGCDSLTNITIPASVISIGDRAFDGCDSLILTVTKSSYAENYAKDNHLHHTTR